VLVQNNTITMMKATASIFSYHPQLGAHEGKEPVVPKVPLQRAKSWVEWLQTFYSFSSDLLVFKTNNIHRLQKKSINCVCAIRNLVCAIHKHHIAEFKRQSW
jgi:hypothetical protein